MDLLLIDLDGTITISDNLVGFSRFMITKKKKFRFLIFYFLVIMLKFKFIGNLKFKTWYSLFILKGMRHDFLNECAKAYVKDNEFEKSINSDVIEFISKQSFAEKIILSANFDFIVEAVSEFLSINRYYGIKLQEVGGIYTSRILESIPYEKEKVNIYRQIIKDKKYDKTIGIGDSKSDLLLLKSIDEGYLIRYNSKNNSTLFERVSG